MSKLSNDQNPLSGETFPKVASPRTIDLGEMSLRPRESELNLAPHILRKTKVSAGPSKPVDIQLAGYHLRIDGSVVINHTPSLPKGTSTTLSHSYWEEVLYVSALSRAIDLVEIDLRKDKKAPYQFACSGHEVPQAMLGRLLTHPEDGVSPYYRGRALMLSLGLSADEILVGSMARSGGLSNGRDLGVIYSRPKMDGSPVVLPQAGDVGAQYAPACGFARSLLYHQHFLNNAAYKGAISVVTGGDGSVATNGFYAAILTATTQRLPVLFFIEDNGYGISVPGEFQTPGGDIAANLSSFKNLLTLNLNGSEPVPTASLLARAVSYVRAGNGPALVRVTVPRLEGHSGQDSASYKSNELKAREKERDPFTRLKETIGQGVIEPDRVFEITTAAEKDTEVALARALERSQPDPRAVHTHVFAPDRTIPEHAQIAVPDTKRANMADTIRRTLDHELATNPRIVIYGEDVGPKGGVAGVTSGLYAKYGPNRVSDTPLSETAIMGMALGMAMNGIMPIPEIQFRKYLEASGDIPFNIGTTRWRTNGQIALPMVVRMAGGYSKCGEPWHSMTGEADLARMIGWKVAFPSDAESAVGLLRTAMRGQDPVFFIEHRLLYDAESARAPYPGDDFMLPFGKARTVSEGSDITIVTWGAMVERSLQAVEQSGVSAHLLDLRTIVPWDQEAVLESVKRTGRCLVIHEDTMTCGFGAEIVATVQQQAFCFLEAPVTRLAVDDIPAPYNVGLLEQTIPNVARISDQIEETLRY